MRICGAGTDVAVPLSRVRLWTAALLLSVAYACIRIHDILSKGHGQDRSQVSVPEGKLDGRAGSSVTLQHTSGEKIGVKDDPSLSLLLTTAQVRADFLQEEQHQQESLTTAGPHEAEPGREELPSRGEESPTVCLAVIAKTSAATELLLRVKHLSSQHENIFSHRYLVVDAKDEKVDASIASVADSLVSEKYLEEWLAVNHSAAYMQLVNLTAAWGNSFRLEVEKVSMGHGSFDSDLPVKELDHYFAIDQCNADYVAILESDMIISRQKEYSWISEGIQALRDNPDLMLVIPAFPGMSQRRVRFRPTTKAIVKSSPPGRFVGRVPLVDTTCEHPYSLPGHASLLDLRRYKQLVSFGHSLEHRCGGMLVRGKPCKQMTYVRKCGGTRSWAAAFECVICNSPTLRQAHLAEEQRCSLWYAPMTLMRYDMGGLRAEISKAELQQ